MFDDKNYWIERHKKDKENISSVGSRKYSDKANYYIYKILKERYKIVLDMLELPNEKNALDAGSGIGIFSEFLHEYGFNVTAVDISQIGLDRISNSGIKKICSTISNIDVEDKSFDLVHSFDVLYHILDDTEWERSLINICRLSKKYIVLHERFFKTGQIISSAHLKARTYTQTTKIINDNGFYEVLSVPTHMIALRLITFRISQYFPKLFYEIDKLLLDRLEKHKIRKFGSHFIKVFERKDIP